MSQQISHGDADRTGQDRTGQLKVTPPKVKRRQDDDAFTSMA